MLNKKKREKLNLNNNVIVKAEWGNEFPLT